MIFWLNIWDYEIIIFQVFHLEKPQGAWKIQAPIFSKIPNVKV